jgi:hypothetical protein
MTGLEAGPKMLAGLRCVHTLKKRALFVIPNPPAQSALPDDAQAPNARWAGTVPRQVRFAPERYRYRGSTFMRNQAEMVSRLVREREAMEARREAEARAMAQDLIQLHVGPDDRIANVSNFYAALVQAIRAARWQGETDRSREDVLSLV